ASMQRTQEVVDRIRDLVQPLQGVAHTTAVAGQSFTLNANGSNFGQFFVSFEGFDKRREIARELGLDMSSTGITKRVPELPDNEVPEAKVSIYTPPPVSGLGSASGFKIIIEDRGDLGLVELQKQIERLIDRSKESAKVEN